MYETWKLNGVVKLNIMVKCLNLTCIMTNNSIMEQVPGKCVKTEVKATEPGPAIHEGNSPYLKKKRTAIRLMVIGSLS